MKRTVTIEIPAESEALVRQLLGLHEELQNLALSAADGTVLDVCEQAVLHQGRDLNSKLLSEAVARRVEAVEKKGRRSAPASAVGPKRTADRRPGSS